MRTPGGRGGHAIKMMGGPGGRAALPPLPRRDLGINCAVASALFGGTIRR